ncbi:MAG: hypothetical protein ACRC8P_01215 [Spiroplasma sp.]
MKVKYASFLKQAIKDYRFWIKLFLGFSQLLTILIFITNTYIRTVRGWGTREYSLIPAFYVVLINFSFFTTLSNLLCGIFFVYSALFHHLEGKTKFDNDAVAKTVVVYITLTLLLYNLDQIMTANPYQFDYVVQVLSFIFEHSLGPIIAILYYFFLYNHQNTESIKQLSKKHLWYMIAGLVGYGMFFWFLGILSKYGGGLGFYYWNGASKFGEGSHFVYPFLDFYHKPYFFKTISGTVESIIMLLAMVLFAVFLEYLYTFIAISVRNKGWQKRFIKNQTVQ